MKNLALIALGAGLAYWWLKRDCGCHDAAKAATTAVAGTPATSSSSDQPSIMAADAPGPGVMTRTVPDTAASSSGCTGCSGAAPTARASTARSVGL